MSEIIRNAYERAILEKNPIPEEMNTEYFEETLKTILGIFGKSLEDTMSKFSLSTLEKSDNKSLDSFLLEWAIKECLPKNPLYQNDLVIVSCYERYSKGSTHEKTYRIFLLSQKDNLRKQDPIWIWENKDLVDKFMALDNPYYRKLKMVEALFPLEIFVYAD